MKNRREPVAEERNQFNTLIGLVKQYSPSGEEATAVKWLVKRMQALGYSRAFADETGNAVGVMGDGPRQIVLLGHIDTVPGEIPVDIVGAIHESPQLYGRGTVDAKGALAAFVDSVAGLGPVAGLQFVVIGAVDEERDSVGARHVANQYRPDFAIIGEPSQWDQITLGYKGSAWAKVNVRRSVAHTASQGETAPEAAIGIWNEIQAWVAQVNANRECTFDQVSPTLRGFSSQEDGFESQATLQIGVRLPGDVDPLQWYAQLEKWVSAAGAELYPIGFPIPAFRAEKNSQLVRAFLRGIRAAGGQPGFVVKTGTADLNIVAPLWDCPAVAYGPGDSGLDHTPQEHIFLNEYGQAVAVLGYVLRELADRF